MPTSFGVAAVRTRWGHRKRIGAAIGLASAASWFGLLTAGHSSLHAHHAALGPQWWSAMASWALMVVAMMWPLTTGSLAAVAAVSSPANRWAAVTVALAAATVPSLVLGAVVGGVAVVTGWAAHQVWWGPLWLGLAAATVWRPARQRLLTACHRTRVIVPAGVRGLQSAAAAGLTVGTRCALLCLPVMIAMAAHDPLVMLLGSAGIWWEFSHPRRFRDPVPVAIFATAAVIAVLPLPW